MNADEKEVKEYLPIEDDRAMRLVFGSAHLRSAAFAILKRNLKFSDEKGCLVQVRSALFSENYQLKRCLADRGGGSKSEVRRNPHKFGFKRAAIPNVKTWPMRFIDRVGFGFKRAAIPNCQGLANVIH